MAFTTRRSRGYQAKIYIDVLGGTDIEKFTSMKLADFKKETWPDGVKMERVGRGFTDVTPAASETVDTESDLLDAGYQKSEVSAKAITYALTGNRYIGDPAQDFIFDKFSKLGGELKTTTVIIDPDGTIRVGVTTLTSPLGWSGAVNANSPVSVTLTIDGQPFVLHTDGTVEAKVDNVTITPEAPTVAVGGTVQLVAALEPEYATNNSVNWSVQDETIATITSDGKLTGVKVGKTMVQVFAKSAESVAEIVPIEVTAAGGSTQTSGE